MDEIKFYIPKSETIPTALRLYVGNTYVEYKRIEGGFRFIIDRYYESEAMEIAEKIIKQMVSEHEDTSHGVSWRTVSVEVIPQEERYKMGTIIEWKYRVRDSY